MISGFGSRSHIEDGDLVRYMDRLMDREEHRLARIHLNECPACAARLDAVEAGTAALPSLLSVLDEPVPAGRREQAAAAMQRARFRGYSRPQVARTSQRPMLQAAAIAALLLTVAFGTPPGRAWVGGAVEALSGSQPGPFAQGVLDALGQEQEPVAAAPQPAAPSAAAPAAGQAERARMPRPQPQRQGPAPGTSAPVQFNPTGNFVLIQFQSRQRIGSATIWIRETDDAVGQVIAGRRSEALEPRPDGLRVRNAATSRADYTITVPTRYRFVRVRIGDEPETVIAISRAKRDWLWTISLAAGDELPPAP